MIYFFMKVGLFYEKVFMFVYDMFASLSNGSSININLEKLSAIQQVSLNMKGALESQISAIVSTYQNMGFTDINADSYADTGDKLLGITRGIEWTND